MNIVLLMIGPHADKYVTEGYNLFVSRLQHYVRFKEIIIPDLKDRKNLTALQVKDKEALLILEKLPPSAFVALLDEQGLEFSSVAFAGLLQKTMNAGHRDMVFIIGGAYGVADSIKQKADLVISLSKMTFTHQFVRLMIAEQLYRAMTILKNEPYHNS